MEEPALEGDQVRIETPEHVVFQYELAGLGSRIIAGLIDLMLIGLALLALLLIVIAFAGGLQGLGTWAIALGAVTAFFTLWGYPIFFEIFWRGQTPGKRSLSMRVIQEGGYALTPQVVIVRNLLRIVDFLPGGYFLGLLVMILNRRYKRVGDFVAGTIVIRDRSAFAAPPRLHPHEAVPQGQEERVAELRRLGIHRLGAEQIQVIQDFMQRRHSLSADARVRLSAQLAQGVCRQLEIPPESGEKFLQCVLAARSQGEQKELGGPAGSGT
jgi:uncharacterized RDD family membrane protein YckC